MEELEKLKNALLEEVKSSVLALLDESIVGDQNFKRYFEGKGDSQYVVKESVDFIG